MAQKTLSIILAASRPLTLAEMNVALSVNRPSDSKDNPDMWRLELESEDDFRETLRRVCGLFVSIYHDKVYFLHQTAREFLLATSPSSGHAVPPWMNSITMRQAHTILAEVCVVYLGYFMPDSSIEELHGKPQIEYMYKIRNLKGMESDDQYPPLLGYSARCWGTHLREAAVETDSVVLQDALRICNEESRICAAWLYLYRANDDDAYLPPDLLGLVIASHFGLEGLAVLLLGKGADVNTVYSDGSTALHMAALRGHKGIAELLMMEGATINTLDSYHRTPLYMAASRAQEAIVGLLAANGASVNPRQYLDSKYLDSIWAPLTIAAFGGHMAVVKLLVASGADVDGGGCRATPLQIAAAHGQKDVVELLVAKGADVNAEGYDGTLTPLRYAAMERHEAIVQLLVANGANVNPPIPARS